MGRGSSKQWMDVSTAANNGKSPFKEGFAEIEDDVASTTSSNSSSFSAPPTQLPPPSLLSPAFTPPSTPGLGTPKIAAAGSIPVEPFPIPKGVPVDSSVPDGGCGTKKPRLLDGLPAVRCIVRARIPNSHTGSDFWLHVYENDADSKQHLAIVFGDKIRSRSLDAVVDGETEADRLIRGAYVGKLFPGRTESGFSATNTSDLSSTATSQLPLVRVHSECYTGETVWSARCDCGEQLDEAARLMSLAEETTGGVIIYLRQEGRGIGLSEKLKAYNLQDLGSDTVDANLKLRHPADARTYGLATAMLLDLGQSEVRLLTNNPEKIRAVEGPNREVVVKERVPMIPLAWRGKEGGVKGPEFEKYLATKVCSNALSCLGLSADRSHRPPEWATCCLSTLCDREIYLQKPLDNKGGVGKSYRSSYLQVWVDQTTGRRWRLAHASCTCILGGRRENAKLGTADRHLHWDGL
jgi:GTP cyclohydrolase II